MREAYKDVYIVVTQVTVTRRPLAVSLGVCVPGTADPKRGPTPDRSA